MSQLPHLLKPGNRVGIISPASHPTSDQWKAGLQVLSDWGLEIVLGDHYLAEHFGLGGTDEQRRSDLQQMLDDPSIAAIFPLRGGYGVSRLLDGLDFTKFRKNPKWIVGFSDITALLCHIDTFSIASIHGPMPNNFCQKGGEAALANLHTLLFEGLTHVHTTSHALNKHGVAEASIIGGNLSLLTHLIGSNSFPNPKGKILFIEEVGERLYHVDRLLLQLKRAGYLADLAGLIIGGFTDCKEASLTIGLGVEDMILEHTADYHYPIAFDFPAGHIPNNQAITIGKKIKFLVNAEIVQVTD
ncbi:LD-carboxypeptidase [Aquirufa sp. OSTEICH-129V]|uniref:LD-carboxypeptidase n=1 Tax=Aquirufa avitistagni TaxID=3104728 RepID=A0ABW6DAS2_9BACT